MIIPYYDFRAFYNKGDKVKYDGLTWEAKRKVPRSQKPTEGKHWAVVDEDE